MLNRPRVALVHDYLTQLGGAERVALELTRAFPGAPLYTSVYDARAHLPRVPRRRRAHEPARPGAALRGTVTAPRSRSSRRRSRAMHVDADVVVCSSSGWAHGVRTDAAEARLLPRRRRAGSRNPTATSATRQRPARTRRSARHSRSRPLLLRRWDARRRDRATRYLANSAVDARRGPRALRDRRDGRPPTGHRARRGLRDRSPGSPPGSSSW